MPVRRMTEAEAQQIFGSEFAMFDAGFKTETYPTNRRISLLFRR